MTVVAVAALVVAGMVSVSESVVVVVAEIDRKRIKSGPTWDFHRSWHNNF